MELNAFFSHPKIARFCQKTQIFRKHNSLKDLESAIQPWFAPDLWQDCKHQTQDWIANQKDKVPSFVSFYEEWYPPLLREIFDPPLVLAYQGNVELLQKPIFSIVGTRKPSPISSLATKLLVQEWKEHFSELSIASGMALGIDRIAFLEAMKHSLPVIGVLGTPLSQEYPPGNRDLYKAMRENPDALLLTEFVQMAEPAKWTFPKRNRVISGLAWRVCVMESSEKSGTLWTAASATHQNRDLYVFDHPLQNNNRGGQSLLEDGAMLLSWKELNRDRGEIVSLFPDADRKVKKDLQIWRESLSRQQTSIFGTGSVSLGRNHYWVPSF